MIHFCNLGFVVVVVVFRVREDAFKSLLTPGLVPAIFLARLIRSGVALPPSQD